MNSLHTWIVIIRRVHTVGSVQDDPLGREENYRGRPFTDDRLHLGWERGGGITIIT